MFFLGEAAGVWLCGFSPSGPDASLGALATQTGSGIRSGVADRGTWIFVVAFFFLNRFKFPYEEAVK